MQKFLSIIFLLIVILSKPNCLLAQALQPDEEFRIQVEWAYSFAPEFFRKLRVPELPPIDLNPSVFSQCGITPLSKNELSLTQLQCDGVLDQSPLDNGIHRTLGDEIRDRVRKIIIQPFLDKGIKRIDLVNIPFEQIDQALDEIQFYHFAHGVLLSSGPTNRRSAINFRAGVPGFEKPTVIINSRYFEFDLYLKSNSILRAALEFHEILSVLGLVDDSNYQTTLRFWWLAASGYAGDEGLTRQLFLPLMAIDTGGGTHVGSGISALGGDMGEFLFKFNLLYNLFIGYTHRTGESFRPGIFSYVDAIADAEISTYVGGYNGRPAMCYSVQKRRFQISVSQFWFFMPRPEPLGSLARNTKYSYIDFDSLTDPFSFEAIFKDFYAGKMNLTEQGQYLLKNPKAAELQVAADDLILGMLCKHTHGTEHEFKWGCCESP